MPFWSYSGIFNEYRNKVKCRNLIGKDPYWTLILLCRVNTNKKIQKSTGYFIFLLKMPRFIEIQSAQIVALLETGLSQSAVAIRMGINRSTVSRVFSWYQETDSYRRRPCQRRPRITTNREDRNIVNEALRVPTRVAQQIGNEALPGRRISTQTVRRHLHERGLRSRIRARVSILTTVHRRTRLRYARNHRNWMVRQWRNVLFTDKSRFCLFENDARIRIWRRRRERFEANYIDPTRAFGGGFVMVWSGISMNRSSDFPTPRIHSGTLHKRSFAFLRDSNALMNRPWFQLDAG